MIKNFLILAFLLTISIKADFRGTWEYDDDATNQYLKEKRIPLEKKDKDGINTITVAGDYAKVLGKQYPYFTNQIDDYEMITILNNQNSPLILSKYKDMIRVINSHVTDVVMKKSEDVTDPPKYEEISGKWTIKLKEFMKANKGLLRGLTDYDLDYVDFLDVEIKGNFLLLYYCDLPYFIPSNIKIEVEKTDDKKYNVHVFTNRGKETVKVEVSGKELKISHPRITTNLTRKEPLKRKTLSLKEIDNEFIENMKWLQAHKLTLKDQDPLAYIEAFSIYYRYKKDIYGLLKLASGLTNLGEDYSYIAYQICLGLIELNSPKHAEKLISKGIISEESLPELYLDIALKYYEQKDTVSSKINLLKARALIEKSQKALLLATPSDKLYLGYTYKYNCAKYSYACSLLKEKNEFHQQLKNDQEYQMQLNRNKTRYDFNETTQEKVFDDSYGLMAKLKGEKYLQFLNSFTFELVYSSKYRYIENLSNYLLYVKTEDEKFEFEHTIVNLACYYFNCKDYGQMLKCLYSLDRKSGSIFNFEAIASMTGKVSPNYYRTVRTFSLSNMSIYYVNWYLEELINFKAKIDSN